MKTEPTEHGDIEVWTPEEVASAFENGEIAIIDVRTPQEYMFEHIEGALLMPMAFFVPEKLPSQNGKRLVFHCGSGARSGRMAKKTLEAGISPIIHMEGGFTAWKQAGLPHITTDVATGAPKRAG